MNSQSTLSAWMQTQADRLEALLLRHLPTLEAAPALAPLHAAMHYAVLQGGKRVRPLLVFATGALADAPPAALEHAAVAVELIHAYSLVHDDLPCMDNDVLRRGKPTVHVQYGQAIALLAGDALQALALEVLSQTPLAAPQVVALLRCLSQASGARGMCGGQAIDLCSVGHTLDLAALENMHRLKTGALLRASVQLGGICANLAAPQLHQLDQYAAALGLAFQVVDDILDVAVDTHTLGKTAGKDADHAKPTYVSLCGLAAARECAETLRQQGQAALANLAHSLVDSQRTARLAQLLDYVVQRQH